jgi:3-deoxy-D-manno-octulosonic-acid transferase
MIALLSTLRGWLLNSIYLLAIVGASPWLIASAVRHGKYRQGWSAKLGGRVPARIGSNPCVWLHAVSLGEVNLLGTLIQQLEKNRPDITCYITTTTRTGYEAACRRYPQQTVSYCPLDFTWAVRRAARRIRPDLLVLAELELWPNMISAVQRQGARVAVVNGRLSARSFRGYQRVRGLLRSVVRNLDLIAVQTDEYAQRFARLGARPDRIVVVGSLKYDGAPTDRANPRIREFGRLADIRPDQTVWLAGSTFEREESQVLQAFEKLAGDFPSLRLIVVPRHPERFDEVAELLNRSPWPWSRRSELRDGGEGCERILLVDSVGELSTWWGLADIGFVGGSLGSRGGQNMIEPAAYGAAICFGPNTINFRDVAEAMLAHEAAALVQGADELADFVRRCLVDVDERMAMGQRARQLVQRHQGAAARTYKLLQQLLPADSLPRRSPSRKSA